MKIRIILADDQTILRKGIRSLFEASELYEIVAEATDGPTAVELARRHEPDIILMDITMPGMNGIEATQQICATNPRIKVIILSVHSDKRFIEKAFAAGALGFLRKDCEFDEVLTALSVVTEGGRYISTSLADAVDAAHLNITIASEAELGAKERAVLRMIAEGKTTKEIAVELKLGVKSIERYRQIIMDKLNLHSIAELTKYAVSEGLVPLG